jgi:hypothetical protein
MLLINQYVYHIIFLFGDIYRTSQYMYPKRLLLRDMYRNTKRTPKDALSVKMNKLFDKKYQNCKENRNITILCANHNYYYFFINYLFFLEKFKQMLYVQESNIQTLSNIQAKPIKEQGN